VCATQVLPRPLRRRLFSAAVRRVILTGGGGAPIDFVSAAAASVKSRRRRSAAWQSRVRDRVSLQSFCRMHHKWARSALAQTASCLSIHLNPRAPPPICDEISEANTTTKL